MAYKVTIPEGMTGWSTGEGKAQRGIYWGNITIEDAETRNGTECWQLKMTPDSVYVPVEGSRDGELEEVEGGAALAIYLWHPDGDDKEAVERELRKLLGYMDAAYGKEVPRGKKLDPVRVAAKGKSKVAIVWDPAPPGSQGVWDQHSPLTAKSAEKLADGEFKLRVWPQDGRVTKAKDAEGGKSGRDDNFKKRGGKGGKKKGSGSADADAFLDDPDDNEL